MGRVFPQAKEQKEYSNHLGEGVGISMIWATAHFLAFQSWPGTVLMPVFVSFSMLVHYNEYNEAQGLLKLNLPQFWAQSVLTSFYCIQFFSRLCYFLRIVPCPLLFVYTFSSLPSKKRRGERQRAAIDYNHKVLLETRPRGKQLCREIFMKFPLFPTIDI